MKLNRNLYSKISTVLYGAVLCFSPLTIIAGTDSSKDLKDTTKDLEIEAPSKAVKNWAAELSCGVLFSNIRSSSGYNNTMVPIQLAAVLKIDDVSLDDYARGVFRGNTEFLFRGNYYQVTYGQENHLGGLSVGPRYNFVQPGWKVVPFVEGTVGILFADSNPEVASQDQHRGLGQDFNFTFGVAVGARYDINDDWYLRLSCDYAHVSNAGQSEPQWKNNPIDALGPKFGVGYRF